MKCWRQKDGTYSVIKFLSDPIEQRVGTVPCITNLAPMTCSYTNVLL